MEISFNSIVSQRTVVLAKDPKTAKEFYDAAVDYKNAGQYSRAEEFFKAAEDMAKNEKDDVLMGKIQRERGRMYYWNVGKAPSAYRDFKSVVGNVGAEKTDAEVCVADIRDMQSFLFSSVGASKEFKNEYAGGKRNSTQVSFNIPLYQHLYGSSTVANYLNFDIGMNYKYVDFGDTKNINAVLVKESDINPTTPAWLQLLKGKKYTLLSLAGAQSYSVNTGYTVPIFAATPWLPKVKLNYMYNWTSLNATANKNFVGDSVVQDFIYTTDNKSLVTHTHDISVFSDLMNLMINPKTDMYRYAWYFTGYGSYAHTFINRSAYKDVFQFMSLPVDPNDDPNYKKPEQLNKDTMSLGIRISSPKTQFKVEDQYSRVNMNFRWQWETPLIADAEAGVFMRPTTKDGKKLQSFHAGVNYEFRIIGVKDTEKEKDTYPHMVKIPISVEAGLTDIWHYMGKPNNLPWYISAALGVEYKGVFLKYNASYGTDGNAYKSLTHNANLGFKF